MDSGDEPPTDRSFEVTMGWDSASPKFRFPDSDTSRTSPNAPVSPVKIDRKALSADTESLGKYAGLLASSPPRPRFKPKRRALGSPTRTKKVGSALSMLSSDLGSEPPAIEDDEATEAPAEVAEKQQTEKQTEKLPNNKEKEVEVKVEEVKVKEIEEIKTPSLAPPPPPPAESEEESEESSDSDIEDMLSLRPVDYTPSFFANRKVRRFTLVERHQNRLQCLDASSQPATIELRGSWTATLASRGDTLHLISPKPSDLLVVDDETDLLLIVNPDVLIPCTSVAEALACERQVVLRTKIRMPADLNINLVLGSIKHEFIQACFTAGNFTTPFMDSQLRAACDAASLDLQLVESDAESAYTQLAPVVLAVQKWAAPLWGSRATGKFVDCRDTKLKIRVTEASQIEEEIRSPYYGLVGKIDVTVEVAVIHADTKKLTTRLSGLEIKTGKRESTSHRAQTALYTLLMAERHPNNTHPWSLLYYTETGATTAVALGARDLGALVQKRNAVAFDMWRLPSSQLPVPVSASEMICKWCSRKNSCALYTAIVDKGATHGQPALQGVYEAALESGKLTPQFLQFIDHWHRLLDLEFEVGQRVDKLRGRQWWLTELRPKLWKVGERIVEGFAGPGYQYRLVPVPGDAGDSTPGDAGELSRDDTILLSTKQHMAVNFGFVAHAGADLRVIVREELSPIGKYRVDVDPWGLDLNLGVAKYNLDSLVEADRLRELVVDLVPPQFASYSKQALESTLSRASTRVLPASPQKPKGHADLNADQAEALNKVLEARDYALILGMPGTGKTTTIAAIVAALVERGKSVLLSAYTNSAVDTLVAKLLDARQPVLRLVSSQFDTRSMDARVAGVTVSMATAGGNARLVEFLGAPVVACTSHGTNNKLFALRRFDYCILDEASQITLPFVLGPLRLASTFVLVGDHFQLPPLVRNAQARLSGLDESLFKRLSAAHPSAVVALTRQYRMAENIMRLASDLVYDGRLVAGTPEVASQKLVIRGWSFINPHSPVYTALDPGNTVVFLNTDKLALFETKHRDGASNAGETAIIVALVKVLADLGVALADTAVISVYRHQLALLTDQLSGYVKQGLEVLTADQAQGRDKKCILVSLVKANAEASAGELLKDWRRLNVAFTRAKQKLVIVGSKRTMQQADGVARFMEYIESRGWVHDAPVV